MSKTGDKTIRAMEEAIAYARGDCEHDWVLRDKTDGHGVTSECRKCGVRVTTYPPPKNIK